MTRKTGAMLLIWGTMALFAQEAPDQGSFIRGALLDGERYDTLPQRAVLAPRTYQALPAEVSLKKYAPIPGDQTPYGTCVAWAAAYGARTISESVITDRRQTRTITGNVYSPVFVYKSVNNDPSCLSGMQIFSALDLMRDEGTPRMLAAERTTDFRQVSLEEFAGERRYTIADYVTLFRAERPGRGNTGPGHVLAVKKSLAEMRPVIIGMNTPESFLHAIGVWQPGENPHRYYGGHALVVVGYDDSRHGGAFEVLNSWGKKWGNAGFIWITYETFGQWVREAYEIIENLAVWSDTSRFSGFARVEAAGVNGAAPGTLPVAFTREGYYAVSGLSAGTRCRLLLGNTDPAYLYAFSINGGEITRVFPPENSTVVPVLDYAESYLTLPGGDNWITAGTDAQYLVIFYAKEKLNSTQIRARLGKSQGSITARTAAAAGAEYFPAESAHCKNDEIRFTAESENSKGVFALIIALE